MASMAARRHCWILVGLASGCARPELAELDQRLAAVEVRAEQQQAERESATRELSEQLEALERRIAAIEEHALRSRELNDGLGRALDELVGEIQRLRKLHGDVGPGRFRKGEKAPVGLSALEIRQHATAQGDPHMGAFTLHEALAGDPALADRSRGKLVATFRTNHGDFDCTLHEDDAPATVANFVGLARGTRSWLEASSGRWVERPLYDGTIFHRVIDRFMIQGGDPEGTGRGGIGYVIADELVEGLEHRPGALSMANRGSNTASSQFFIMVSHSPHLDGKHSIFGQCDAKVPEAIATVPVDHRAGDRPIDPVVIDQVLISRKKSR